jgi:hypothetical protein
MVMFKAKRVRWIIAALAPVIAFISVMFGVVTSASASGIGDPYNPPSVTDGNDWYNGQEAASYAIATVDQVQPFDEACAHCPLLPRLPCLHVRFLALRYGLVTIRARTVILR